MESRPVTISLPVCLHLPSPSPPSPSLPFLSSDLFILLCTRGTDLLIHFALDVLHFLGVSYGAPSSDFQTSGGVSQSEGGLDLRQGVHALQSTSSSTPLSYVFRQRPLRLTIRLNLSSRLRSSAGNTDAINPGSAASGGGAREGDDNDVRKGLYSKSDGSA
jgi:hypothetical protein